jgi:hypothetical protein
MQTAWRAAKNGARRVRREGQDSEARREGAGAEERTNGYQAE